MSRAIIIMLKSPRPGEVKTRMSPFLTSKQSAELAKCFAQDAAANAKSHECSVIIAYSPENELEFLTKILPDNLIFTAQNGIDLGERIHRAIEFARAQNFRKIIVIGTDSPNLPREFIEQAFDSLEQKDVVLGATEDGGYYLIGVNKPNYEIFRNVEWSSSKEFVQTVQNVEKLALTLEKLPVWYDIDFPKDLQRLHRDLQNTPEIAPKTFEWLEKNNNT